jgi:hypothetical protein
MTLLLKSSVFLLRSRRLQSAVLAAPAIYRQHTEAAAPAESALSDDGPREGDSGRHQLVASLTHSTILLRQKACHVLYALSCPPSGPTHAARRAFAGGLLEAGRCLARVAATWEAFAEQQDPGRADGLRQQQEARSHALSAFRLSCQCSDEAGGLGALPRVLVGQDLTMHLQTLFDCHVARARLLLLLVDPHTGASLNESPNAVPSASLSPAEAEAVASLSHGAAPLALKHLSHEAPRLMQLLVDAARTALGLRRWAAAGAWYAAALSLLDQLPQQQQQQQQGADAAAVDYPQHDEGAGGATVPPGLRASLCLSLALCGLEMTLAEAGGTGGLPAPTSALGGNGRRNDLRVSFTDEDFPPYMRDPAVTDSPFAAPLLRALASAQPHAPAPALVAFLRRMWTTMAFVKDAPEDVQGASLGRFILIRSAAASVVALRIYLASDNTHADAAAPASPGILSDTLRTAVETLLWDSREQFGLLLARVMATNHAELIADTGSTPLDLILFCCRVLGRAHGWAAPGLSIYSQVARALPSQVVTIRNELLSSMLTVKQGGVFFSKEDASELEMGSSCSDMLQGCDADFSAPFFAAICNVQILKRSGILQQFQRSVLDPAVLTVLRFICSDHASGKHRLVDLVSGSGNAIRSFSLVVDVVVLGLSQAWEAATIAGRSGTSHSEEAPVVPTTCAASEKPWIDVLAWTDMAMQLQTTAASSNAIGDNIQTLQLTPDLDASKVNRIAAISCLNIFSGRKWEDDVSQEQFEWYNRAIRFARSAVSTSTSDPQSASTLGNHLLFLRIWMRAPLLSASLENTDNALTAGLPAISLQEANASLGTLMDNMSTLAAHVSVLIDDAFACTRAPDAFNVSHDDARTNVLRLHLAHTAIVGLIQKSATRYIDGNVCDSSSGCLGVLLRSLEKVDQLKRHWASRMGVTVGDFIATYGPMATADRAAIYESVALSIALILMASNPSATLTLSPTTADLLQARFGGPDEAMFAAAGAWNTFVCMVGTNMSQHQARAAIALRVFSYLAARLPDFSNSGGASAEASAGGLLNSEKAVKKLLMLRVEVYTLFICSAAVWRAMGDEQEPLTPILKPSLTGLLGLVKDLRTCLQELDYHRRVVTSLVNASDRDRDDTARTTELMQQHCAFSFGLYSSVREYLIRQMSSWNVDLDPIAECPGSDEALLEHILAYACVFEFSATAHRLVRTTQGQNPAAYVSQTETETRLFQLLDAYNALTKTVRSVTDASQNRYDDAMSFELQAVHWQLLADACSMPLARLHTVASRALGLAIQAAHRKAPAVDYGLIASLLRRQLHLSPSKSDTLPILERIRSEVQASLRSHPIASASGSTLATLDDTVMQEENGRLSTWTNQAVYPLEEADYAICHAWNSGVAFYKMRNYSKASMFMGWAVSMLQELEDIFRRATVSGENQDASASAALNILSTCYMNRDTMKAQLAQTLQMETSRGLGVRTGIVEQRTTEDALIQIRHSLLASFDPTVPETERKAETSRASMPATLHADALLCKSGSAPAVGAFVQSSPSMEAAPQSGSQHAPTHAGDDASIDKIVPAVPPPVSAVASTNGKSSNEDSMNGEPVSADHSASTSVADADDEHRKNQLQPDKEVSMTDEDDDDGFAALAT